MHVEFFVLIINIVSFVIEIIINFTFQIGGRTQRSPPCFWYLQSTIESAA
jgi:hypothetical protein